MNKISAVIITYNESNNIERCINSLVNVVDEILVVDSFSTDNTPDICKRLNVKFVQNPFNGHIEQKNFAMKMASFNLVLSLDADECLSDELAKEIVKIKSNWQADAFSFNRLTSYCGKWIKTCGWYPDIKIRLWDRRKGKWGGENPHDKVVMENDAIVQHCNKDILHYSFPTIASHINTANNFSSIAAKEANLKGKKVVFIWHIVLNPAFTFLQKFIFRMGFMDGYYGYTISRISAFSNFLKYTKLRELNRVNTQKSINK